MIYLGFNLSILVKIIRLSVLKFPCSKNQIRKDVFQVGWLSSCRDLLKVAWIAFPLHIIASRVVCSLSFGFFFCFFFGGGCCCGGK